MAPKKSKSSKVFKDPPKGPKVKVPKPSPIAHLLILGDQDTFQSHYDHAIDRFRTNVQVNGRQAYRDLVYEIKEIVSSLFPDEVATADLTWIVASIPSPTAANFQSDMSMEEVTERNDPVGADDEPYKIDLNDLSQFTSGQQAIINRVRTNATTARHYLKEMHHGLAKLRPKVSHIEHLAIIEAVKVPQTKINVVPRLVSAQSVPAQQSTSQGTSQASSSQGVSSDDLVIAENIPNPARYDRNTNPHTALLAALVHYVMRLNLVGSRKLHIGQENCALLFNVSKSALKRVFTGNVRKGGKQYLQEKERAAELAQAQAKAEKAERQQAAAAQLVGQTTTVQIGSICHVCGEGFNSNVELQNHLINHQRLARWLSCPWCKKAFNEFIEFQEHEKAHDGKYICCECLHGCESYKELSAHVKTHKFNCPVCKQETNSRDKLAFHMKIIHGQEISLFRCGVCPAAFCEEIEYQAHFNEDHRLKIRCKICCVGFKLQEELNAHTTEKHPSAQEVVKEADSSDPARTVNPLDTIEGGTVKPVGISLPHCPVCGVYFSNGELYKGHINTYHQHLMVTCKFCNQVMFSPEVGHHITVTHITCFSCLKSFASEELLQAHMLECTAPASQVSSVTVPAQPDDPAPFDIPEPPPAPIPQQPTARPTPQASGSDQPPAPVSKSPGRASRPDKPFACEYCEKRFTKVVSYHMHKSQVHKNLIDPALLNTPAHCDLCDKDFASYVDLEQHNEDAHKSPAIPTPSRPIHHYYCPFNPCEYFGYTDEDVHRHQRSSHWHDFIYRCNKCKFVSDSVNSLGMHNAKDHLGPFVDIGESIIIACNLCQYKAQGWERFFVHIRTHSQNKFPCSECQWTFCSAHALNRHAITTHDTRHFGCGFCILDFPSNDALCTHTISHQINCHLCWEPFITDSAFNKHMERKHPSRQMTMQQSRTADEEQAWINQQKKKCIQQLKRKIRKELAEEEDRKRKLQDDTSVQPPQPTASTSSGSPRKKRKRKQPDPADLPDDDDNGDEPPDDDQLDPDFEPEEEEDDDDDEEDGGNDD